MTWPRALRVDAEDAESGWWGQIWPIGGVFLTVSANNPADDLRFGTWQLIGSGAVPIGWTGSGPLGQAGAPLSGNPSQSRPTIVMAMWQRIS